jgi:hypothetical protein
MKKIFLLFINSMIFVFIVSAQDYSHEFGKNNPDEFRLTVYDQDSSAEAVMLYNIGKTSYVQDDYGFRLLYEMRTKIKILSTAGLKWAEINIPFYEGDNKKEMVFELKGNTYNFENNIIRTTPLDSKNTFTEKTEENWRLLKFAMPDVKVGSVFEFSYQILSPFITQFRPWHFQENIPVVYSEFSASMVPFFEYKYFLQGAKTFDYFKEYVDPGSSNKQFFGDNYSAKVFLFVMKNLPAFKDESFMISANDYIIKLDFHLLRISYPKSSVQEISTSWPTIINYLLEEEDAFGKYLRTCQHKSKDLIDTMHGILEKSKNTALVIENYLKSNFTWDHEFGIYASKSVNEFLRTKSGSAADINLFLVGMLNAAGIEAYPLLISTRRHGKIKTNFPSSKSFNYLMAYVKIEDKLFILDATDPLNNFNEIPTNCLSEMGLIVKKGKESNWLKYSNTVRSFITATMELFPGSVKDSITGNYRIVAGGYDALQLRKKYIKGTKDLKDELRINDFAMTDTMKVDNCRVRQKNFEVSFRANMHLVSNTTSENEQVEKRIIFQPFCNISISENPFKQTTRTFPINLSYRHKESYISTIHLPEGYTVFSKPEDLVIDNPNVRITYQIETIDGNTFRVTGSYEFKKDVYEAALYSDLKSYFSTIVDKFNEKLILAKK